MITNPDQCYQGLRRGKGARHPQSGQRVGHAGALILGGADTAQAKLDIMAECGIPATKNPSEMARLLKDML